jgi:hypothetical protein
MVNITVKFLPQEMGVRRLPSFILTSLQTQGKNFKSLIFFFFLLSFSSRDGSGWRQKSKTVTGNLLVLMVLAAVTEVGGAR